MLSPLNRIFGVGGKANDTDLSTDEIIQLPIEKIIPNRFQPREIFNEDKIKELAQTIRTHGIIQPIVVRKLEDDRYELIAGERRMRATETLGWENIPAIIRDMTDTETASVALIENLQREELTVIEEANAYQQLIELHSLTQEALAQRLGKSQSTIANKIRLLKLPAQVQQALSDQLITERHARALMRIKEEEVLLSILEKILEQGLNVRQTEELIENYFNPKEKKQKPRLKGFSKDVRIAMNTIRQSLSMVEQSGIDVETDEEDHDDYYQITIKIPKK